MFQSVQSTLSLKYSPRKLGFFFFFNGRLAKKLQNLVFNIYVSGKRGNETMVYTYIWISERKIVLTYMWCDLEILNELFLLHLQQFKAFPRFIPTVSFLRIQAVCLIQANGLNQCSKSSGLVISDDFLKIASGILIEDEQHSH